MGRPAAACDRCGKSLALEQAWILVQDDEHSTLCEPCALDVGPALTTSPGTRLLPPSPPPPPSTPQPPPPPEPAAVEGDGWAGRHPIAWLFGSLLLLALALTPIVFFYWLASR